LVLKIPNCTTKPTTGPQSGKRTGPARVAAYTRDVDTLLWTHIVELYEYKVDDMLNARTPKGGERSIRELRELLSKAPLVGAVLRRFRLADRAMRGKPEVISDKADVLGSETQMDTQAGTGQAGAGQAEPTNAEASQTKANQAVTTPDQSGTALNIDMSFTPDGGQFAAMSGFETVEVNEDAIDEEGATLRALSEASWRADFHEELLGQSTRLRNEPERATIRAVFATVQNLEQYAESSDFGNDLNLAKFKVISRIPATDDLLATFSSPEVIENTLEDFLKKMLEMRREHPNLQLQASETLSYLRRFALAVIDDHRAGEQQVVSGPSAKEIQSAIDEVRKENLSADAKQDMVNKLTQQLNVVTSRERDYQSAYQNERKTLKVAIEAFFVWLAERVPARWGGRSKDMPVPTKILGAQTPSRFIETAPADATEIAVRLLRPGYAVLDGLSVQWQTAPEGWVLEVAGAEYPLQDGLRVPAEDREVLVFVSNGYALLRSRRREGGGLWKLLALTRCVGALLETDEDFLALRLARAAVSFLRDRRIDVAQHSPESAERYRTAPEQTLASFARTGAEKLLERFERSTETGYVERCFRTAAEALNEEGADELAERLIELFQDVLDPEEVEPIDGLEVKSAKDVLLIAYRGEPVTVRVMGRAFTVRTDNMGKVYAIQAGAGGQSLEDVLPQRIPGGFALLAREGLRIAIGFMKSA
jgi:hypothetical protein